VVALTTMLSLIAAAQCLICTFVLSGAGEMCRVQLNGLSISMAI
jgi:hypothetical protein